MRPIPVIILAMLVPAGLQGAPAAAPVDSPFMPDPSSAPARSGPAPGQCELAGITVLGPEILVTIVEPDKKKQRTLAVGARAGEIEVVRCDPDKAIAVIRYGAETQTLTLRKPATKAGSNVAPTPVAATAANAAIPIPNVGPAGGALPPVKPLVTREEQEREARMLVSDLLEIGMRQRKAYEEAQRKAAAEGKSPAKQ